MEFSNKERHRVVEMVQQKPTDLVVIGGGITGAGIALDAISRGMSVLVLDMQDFAAGTSSRSTKLVHGGLRYLKQFEIGVVAEVGKERAIVYENGPHITTPEWMLLPFYKGGTFGPFSTNIGLRVYDFLAGVKKSERRKMLSAEEATRREPLLKKDGLLGAGYYVEYKTDDARLTIEVLKKAVELGAIALNYVKVDSFTYDTNHQVTGVVCTDHLTDQSFSIHAKQVVNAAGPWVDTLREKDQSKTNKTLQLTKGIHLVFDQSDFPLQQAIYFDTPDNRMIFAIPRAGKTYVGTTDTVYSGEIAHPTVTVQDRTYILEAISDMFPSLDLTEKEVESSWAGLRPLIHEDGKSPSEISRKDEIFESPSGLLSIAGGKLTGYRKMAESIVDRVAKRLEKNYHLSFVPSQTKSLPLSGGDVGGSNGFTSFLTFKLEDPLFSKMSKVETQRLLQRYGSNVDQVMGYYDENAPMDSLVFAILQYSILHEMVYKPTDFFIRRTGALFFDIQWVEESKEAVCNYLSSLFKWSKEEEREYRNELEKAIFEATTANK